jgi:hypothetical protein
MIPFYYAIGFLEPVVEAPVAPVEVVEKPVEVKGKKSTPAKKKKR